MRNYTHNDQTHIADGLLMEDDFINQTARISYAKISYYKFTLLRPSFKDIREELRENIRQSLFHFSSPAAVLMEVNYCAFAAAN